MNPAPLSSDKVPTGDLGQVTAVIVDTFFERFDVRGLFTGDPDLGGDHDFEYNSWRFTCPGSRATFHFDRPEDATGLAVGVVWAGWGEQTQVNVVVNGHPLAEAHAVHGEAWANPRRETFPIPPDLLRATNSVTVELRADSPMVLFLQSICLTRV